MIKTNIKVIDKLGLHLRPASKLISITNNYKSEIFIQKADQVRQTNSVLSILNLEIKVDDTITIIVDGSDEATALPAILQLLKKENFCIIV
ncbi:hypothetical protein CI105_03935 [Candidatus Izimaplasma bacterium ZiA1]|uniref:HPr family phosphocarrier protein n=1 Tax=Candidatus Izimoplasma sp. ZiA1 TaxID=2024899 RepID=UPI000BAA6992|nr:hypothetical protein CI105_03935 [Candidatus Izimaplasma bacterium ZiA1]